MIRNRTLLLALRIIVGGVFVYAGAVKALDPLDFAQNVRNFRVVGQTLSFLTALVLPWIEIFAGLLLAAGFMKRAAALLVALMLVFFIGLTAATIVRGLDVDCGCFGALSRKAGWSLIVEDGVLLFMTIQVLFAGPKSRRPPSPC